MDKKPITEHDDWPLVQVIVWGVGLGALLFGIVVGVSLGWLGWT